MRPATLAFALSLVTLPALAQDPPPLPDGAEIFEKLIELHRPMYEKYKGIESKAESKTWMYDSETKEIKETSEMVAVNQQLFYEPPGEPTILEYVKNGEELPPEEYDHRGGGEPMYPIFDAHGPEHYSLKVIDRSAMRRQPCLVIEIKAKEKTARHFEGTLYVNAETLEPIYMDGGMADTPFGVDSMRFQTYMKREGDLFAWESSNFTAVVDIPIIFPDTMMVSKSKVLEVKGIPK